MLRKLRDGSFMPTSEQLSLALKLAFPSIMSQLVTIVMEYLDTAMVGHLGAQASAAIGLVSTTTWLVGGLCSALGGGFAVMVAQSIGAGNTGRARRILRQAIVFTLAVSSVIGVAGVIVSGHLPYWLGGGEDIAHDASVYFLVFAAAIPLWEMSFLMAAMLRSAGNMLVPSIVNIAVCVLDVAFNYIFIFLLDMGVLGAALGSLCAISIGAFVFTVYVLFFSEDLKIRKDEEGGASDMPILRPAMMIGVPMAVQHAAMCSAHIASTAIVAPLGTVAIAAHAFGITIEGLCYMPGYGIGDAAITLIGQTVGAKRPDLQRSFSRLTMLLGVGFMTMMGILMFAGVPYLMQLMTPDPDVQLLTTQILRIEAFAEPLYAASIIAFSIFVGAGDTRVPAIMNLASMWIVRLPAAFFLARTMGLTGVWIAMCGELCFRGIIFLIRLRIKFVKVN